MPQVSLVSFHGDRDRTCKVVKSSKDLFTNFVASLFFDMSFQMHDKYTFNFKCPLKAMLPSVFDNFQEKETSEKGKKKKFLLEKFIFEAALRGKLKGIHAEV